MHVGMFLLHSLLQNCHAWLYLCFFYTVYFKTVTHGCIYVSSIQSTSKLSHMTVSVSSIQSTSKLSHMTVSVSSKQSTSKLSHLSVSMFLLYSLLQNCHLQLYLRFSYIIYFKTITHGCIYVFSIVYFKPVTHGCIYVSSIQSTSKLSHMAVSMFLLYGLLQNYHTWLYLCLNDSFFPNFQAYNQFHIYNNIPRPQWQSKVLYILLILIWF